MRYGGVFGLQMLSVRHCWAVMEKPEGAVLLAMPCGCCTACHVSCAGAFDRR